jgi:hypothetical protein
MEDTVDSGNESVHKATDKKKKHKWHNLYALSTYYGYDKGDGEELNT